MISSLSSQPNIKEVMNWHRNADKWTQNEFCKIMESLGFKWKDFNPDDYGTKYKTWYYKTIREVDISGIWWGGNAQLIFYQDKENPIPDHPRKGTGKFKAIYLHQPYGICDVTLVEAEIANVQARVEYVDGAKLMVSRTSSTRLIPYSPAVFNELQKIKIQYDLSFDKFHKMTAETLWKEHQASIKTKQKRTLK